jgi:hypothetical protein
MLPILALATLALSTPAQITVNFTSDSVYTHESIIEPKEVVEQEDGYYTIVLQQDNLLGYCIYDNPETEYLDGLKFDDSFVTNYTIKGVDLSVEHNILIKTVYTDDIAGMLAAAKDGDFSKVLANPLMIIQLGYYILAAISIILGGFGLFKSKKKKIKTIDEITSSINEKALSSSTALQEVSTNLITSLITPTLEKLQTQNQAIIEAFILAQSGDKDSKLALVDLLKNTATEDVTLLSDNLIKAVEEAAKIKEKAKEEANKVIKEIASGNFEGNSEDNDLGGISI